LKIKKITLQTPPPVGAHYPGFSTPLLFSINSHSGYYPAIQIPDTECHQVNLYKFRDW